VPVPTPTEVAKAAEFPLTVTDSNGQPVVFEQAPQRIVVFDSAVLEILFALGEGGRIIATHDFVTYPPEAADIARVGDAFNINVEKIVSLQPDLVFVFFPTALETLRNASLKVLYLESLNDDFTKVADNIRLWGRIVGNPDAAEREAEKFGQRVEAIRTKLVSQGEGPSVFQDVGSLWTPGPDTLVGEVFDLLKLRNIANDITGYAQLSPEQVVERNPELIIALDPQAIVDTPAFKDVSAVKNGKVITLENDPLEVAGPRFVDGIEAVARAAYPDLFP
jgi:iron complex transport system substrate-binding protein